MGADSMTSVREQRLKDFRELDKILKVGDLVRYKMDGPRDQYAIVISRKPDAVFPGFWLTWMNREWLGADNGTMSLHSAHHFKKGRMEVVR